MGGGGETEVVRRKSRKLRAGRGDRKNCTETVIQGYRYTGIQGYRDTGIQGYRGTGIQGYRDTEIRGYRDTGIQGHRDAGICAWVWEGTGNESNTIFKYTLGFHVPIAIIAQGNNC